MKDTDKAELAQYAQKGHCPFEGTDTCDECRERGIQCPSMRIGEEGLCEHYEITAAVFLFCISYFLSISLFLRILLFRC